MYSPKWCGGTDNGYRYWFVEEEITELHRLSQQFHVQTTEYEMLLKGFEKPEADEECYADYFGSKLLTGIHFGKTVQRMGEALRKAEFERLSKRLTKGANPVQCYRIKKIKTESILRKNRDL